MDDESMSKNSIIANVRDLIDGVNRERIWIITIGLMGIIFSIVFATTMFFLNVLRPAGLVEKETLRPIVQLAEWLFGICSVISTVAGVKVLHFIISWQKRYSHLKAAEKELEKKYFESSPRKVSND
jgi:hypothetical protein